MQYTILTRTFSVTIINGIIELMRPLTEKDEYQNYKDHNPCLSANIEELAKNVGKENSAVLVNAEKLFHEGKFDPITDTVTQKLILDVKP